EGQMPIFTSNNEAATNDSSIQAPDFFLFPAENAEEAANWIQDLVCQRIPAKFGLHPLNDIQVLAPMYRGAAGVTALNERLQEALNPAAPGKVEKRFGVNLFRVGDRVIQQRNNYDLDVYNGDVGVAAAIDHAEELLYVQFDDGRNVAYDFAILDELSLAYALSVHKSQGGEYPVVVLPMLMSHYAMLQRNLLYTAVTRARQLAIIVGDRRAIATAVANYEVQDRYSGLTERLRRGR
ncbi:MAG: ATP-binding domain-containing protein, partial [Oscillochloris sp.]|nr:ATP-binding domain-containing protein [Oscillochloris sp.]